MSTTITYTHTVILANGMQTTFQSVWPAHEVVGGLTFIETESGFEYHVIKNVVLTVVTKESIWTKATNWTLTTADLQAEFPQYVVVGFSVSQEGMLSVCFQNEDPMFSDWWRELGCI